MIYTAIFFFALIVTGGIWLMDALVLKRRRAADATEPLLVGYAKGLFPVILIVFTMRSFLVEPFKIPSGSMIPTLQVGDYILANKYAYGVRLPLVNKKVIPLGDPQRGDVVVFQYPDDPAIIYIKRVVGVPGDVVEYRDKRLIVNGMPVETTEAGTHTYVAEGLDYVSAAVYQERLGKSSHAMMVEPERPSVVTHQVADFPYGESCSYNSGGEGFVCKVPDGHYMTLGDNRDASYDSRYWGFVPDKNILGKAFFVWMNFNDLGRIGTIR